MADVNIFLLVNYIMNILPDKHFETVFEWLSLTWQFAQLLFEHCNFLNTDISQGSVATYLRCGGIFTRVCCKFTTDSATEKNLKIG